MAEDALLALLEKLQSTRVLVVGDIMLDRFIYGHVTRISPESPVPVLAVKREDAMLGGAGNALRNLNGLGAHGHIISLIGTDQQGLDIREQIMGLGFSDDGLIENDSRPTIVKTRFLAGHQQLLRTDAENAEIIDDVTAKQVKNKVDACIDGFDAVIISDYGKGFLRRDVIAHIIASARAHNIPVIVDPKGQDFSIYKGATAITPNKKELSEATKGHKVDLDEDIIAAAHMVIDECGVDSVIATRSSDGISVVTKDAAPVHIRSQDIEVFDVSGAGDTVIAAIAATIGAGGNLAQAALVANIAGSIVVTKVGTASIKISELRAALDEDSHALEKTNAERAFHSHIFNDERSAWEDAADIVKRWKAKGLKVGFTNGCFDILHFGHVSYLNETRRHCDRLIVALNSDTSVRILKGAMRPVHDEQSRAHVLAALGAVDMAVIFGAQGKGQDNTANALLEILKPDVYFKGGDYTEDEIPETPTVKGYGGHVHVMNVFEGHSTTHSIAKINAK